MINIKVIKTQKDHEEALSALEELMIVNPKSGSKEADQLQLLATLIEDYERNNFSSSLPSPIEAIRFRMEQQNLKPVDLEPYIGSRSKASEILSGKRPLTIKMIRALESGLDIPFKVLIQETESRDTKNILNWSTKLVSEITTRINGVDLSKLFQFRNQEVQFAGLLRQSNYRTSPLTDKNALAAWFGCVLKRAEAAKINCLYKKGTVNLQFMRKVAQMSILENAPKKIQNFLLENGIILVIEPHFKGTRLDGAAIFVDKNNPIIALTLRFDRLDSFWFTLMHELAHIALHSEHENHIFYDELENVSGVEISKIEKEADTLASEALVPSDKWEVSAAKLIPSKLAASALASEIGVHMAIVAGKIRYEMNSWNKLTKIITESAVRDYFPEVMWIK
ncbi:MAG: ImmA/IrrE family metallo-endopeptidase [Patescibacteria group bacterium]